MHGAHIYASPTGTALRRLRRNLGSQKFSGQRQRLRLLRKDRPFGLVSDHCRN